MDSLSGFTVFVRVAETRSIVGAARTLGVSASAVGKRVARLEEKLGVRLFHRSTRSITLTAEGSLFLERSRRILAEIEATELELSQSRETPRGRLRVSLPLVSGLVLPTLADFMQAYPDIELDLDFSDRVVDVVDEGFDVVLRTGQPVDSRLSMRELGEFQLKLVGSPAYFARHGTPRCPEDLLRHTCLHYRSPIPAASRNGRCAARTAKPRRRSRCRWSATTSRPASASPCATRASPACRTSRSARRCAKGAWSASSTPSASAARGSSCSGRPAARSRPSCAPSSTSSRHG
nr:LysR family transcriptional regulator [Pseudomonas aeruginosa]